MAYEPLHEWMSIDDLVGLPLNDRIRYVRTNLRTPRATARNAYMSHDDFARAVGAADRGSAIAWEKDRQPRDYAEKIAALTPYPAAAFGAPGEAELVRETLGRRLQSLEAAFWRLEPLLERVGSLQEQLDDLDPRVAALEHPRRRRTTGEVHK